MPFLLLRLLLRLLFCVPLASSSSMLLLLSLLQVDFGSFATILREVAFLMEPDQGQVFYDLGSGTGKAVYVVRKG